MNKRCRNLICFFFSLEYLNGNEWISYVRFTLQKKRRETRVFLLHCLFSLFFPTTDFLVSLKMHRVCKVFVNGNRFRKIPFSSFLSRYISLTLPPPPPLVPTLVPRTFMNDINMFEGFYDAYRLMYMYRCSVFSRNGTKKKGRKIKENIFVFSMGKW